MAFRMTIEKFQATTGEYWVNVYWTSVLSLENAVNEMTAVVNAERAIYFNNTIITKGRVDDGVPGTNEYRTQTYNLAGLRETNDIPNQLPLFVVVRVDFNAQGGGSPSRKYLRGALHEAEAGITSLSAGLISVIQTYADAIVAASITDQDGSALISGSVFPAPAMRQLRRGSKKPSTP